MSYYERNLPHWHPEGTPLFLTWCLHGCIQHNRPRRVEISAGRAFHERDLELDRLESGATWLSNPAIARCVVEALHYGQNQKWYELIAYVVMPNHVHVVLTPRLPLPKITQSLKWYTARRANAILNRTGQPFWQDESYDHWIRDAKELAKIIRYIENNPVRAALVNKAEDWPWCWVSP